MQLPIKLPRDIAGLPYYVHTFGKTVTIQVGELATYKETFFQMESKTFASGECYLLIPQNGTVLFQEG